MKTLILLALLVSCGKDPAPTSGSTLSKQSPAQELVTPPGTVFPKCMEGSACYDYCYNSTEYQTLNTCSSSGNSFNRAQCEQNLMKFILQCREGYCETACRNAGVLDDKIEECVNSCK